MQQPQITLGLAMSADGDVIKGLARLPSRQQHLKHLIRTRKQNRKARQSTSVSNAIIIEQAQDMGTSFENGIPSNATIKCVSISEGLHIEVTIPNLLQEQLQQGWLDLVRKVYRNL